MSLLVKYAVNFLVFFSDDSCGIVKKFELSISWVQWKGSTTSKFKIFSWLSS